jgi:uncharacterized protein (DUF2267 family)
MIRPQLLARVRELGRYDTDDEAARVLDAVLGTLGGQLVGEELDDLAAALPGPAATALASRLPLTEPLDAPAFVDAVAAALGTTHAEARWHASSALAALAGLLDPGLTDRILAQLPRGYALLFCRADLTPAAA